jgi:hypothetical protein
MSEEETPAARRFSARTVLYVTKVIVCIPFLVMGSAFVVVFIVGGIFHVYITGVTDVSLWLLLYVIGLFGFSSFEDMLSRYPSGYLYLAQNHPQVLLVAFAILFLLGLSVQVQRWFRQR